MSYSRRDLTRLLPALTLGSGAAQNRTLPSKTWRFEDLELKKNSRAVLNGETHGGFNIDMHETELPPGESPHPPHHHVHEEMVMIREGIMEVTIAGSVTKIGSGGVAYVASNEEHGWRNVGTTPAHYFVLALGREA
ncbi:MAG: cupin domain-containing protein [Acidobacteriota bacterium]|nr:cupin domain-containing protein [Acidobacteriota bacterium]